MSEENVDNKPDYLSSMSHEMRSALNTILASCTMANNHLDDKIYVQDYLKKIFVTVDHLTNLIDDYLDLCRINDGKLFLVEENFCINDLGEELRVLMEPLAEEKGVTLDVKTGSLRNKEVVGDYSRLLQVLINLAANSVKYTPSGGTVDIVIEETEENNVYYASYRFVCSDNGIGISEPFLEHIFEPFTRADDERVRTVRGTGLGMSIVKDIVEAMGGSIHINSMIDVGTTVAIIIKLRKNIRKG